MITRKKLDFTLLDVIKLNNEQLYYIPYNGYHKFTVSTSHCLKCNAALVIGFRKDEFIVSTCKCSADLVIAKDTVKRKIAESHGYTLLTIWDTDDVNQAITKITNLIEGKLNEI
jgi:hypothetical protein